MDTVAKQEQTLLSDYLLHLSENSKQKIVNDYQKITKKLTSSSWFSPTILKKRAMKIKTIQIDQLIFKSSPFFMNELRILNVTDEETEIIKQNVHIVQFLYCIPVYTYSYR